MNKLNFGKSSPFHKSVVMEDITEDSVSDKSHDIIVTNKTKSWGMRKNNIDNNFYNSSQTRMPKFNNHLGRYEYSLNKRNSKTKLNKQELIRKAWEIAKARVK